MTQFIKERFYYVMKFDHYGFFVVYASKELIKRYSSLIRNVDPKYYVFIENELI